MRGDRWTRIPDYLSRPAHWFDESDAPDPDTLRLKAFEKAEIRRALHGPQRGEIILALESLHYLIDTKRMEAMRGIEHVGMGAAERSTIAAFFQSLSGHLKRLIEAVPEPEETPSEDDVDRVQSLLEDLKK